MPDYIRHQGFGGYILSGLLLGRREQKDGLRLLVGVKTK